METFRSLFVFNMNVIIFLPLILIIFKSVINSLVNLLSTYRFESIVHTCMMPKDKFIPIGKGHLLHDMNGFKLTGVFEDQKYEVQLPAASTYGVHIEYEYLGKYGDCVDLNTMDNTYYVYPECAEFAVTKMSLATEELFKYHYRRSKND